MKKPSWIDDFKQFIMRGNVIDMAVGVIIGGAFNNIVSSLVNDIVMPVITLITGKINFTDMLIALDGNSYPSLKAAQDAAAPVIAYGNLIQIVVQFLLTFQLLTLGGQLALGLLQLGALFVQLLLAFGQFLLLGGDFRATRIDLLLAFSQGFTLLVEGVLLRGQLRLLSVQLFHHLGG